jgi:hypothetical protein
MSMRAQNVTGLSGDLTAPQKFITSSRKKVASTPRHTQPLYTQDKYSTAK